MKIITKFDAEQEVYTDSLLLKKNVNIKMAKIDHIIVYADRIVYAIRFPGHQYVAEQYDYRSESYLFATSEEAIDAFNTFMEIDESGECKKKKFKCSK